MRRLPRSLYSPPMVVALVALSIVVGETLVSAHGGIASDIHACVGNTDGSVQITADPTPFGDPGEGCRTGTHPLDWNVQGVPGPQGPQGPNGLQGPPGPGGVKGTTFVGNRTSVTGEDVKTVGVSCPAGTYRTGGGHGLGGSFSGVVVTRSKPTSKLRWSVRAREDYTHVSGAWGLRVYVVCVKT